jgi:hypothetical protein
MTRTDWFNLLLPLVCAAGMVVTFYLKGKELDSGSLASGAVAMFLMGLAMRTKAEKLFEAKLDQMKKEIDELK